MRLPTMAGVIDRRILVNYRADPDVLRRILPRPFRPKLVAGNGMAGICLIRLRQVRPRGVPAALGVASENAAHRIAVEWEDGGRTHEGVWVPRRDTSSRVNALAGGRLFPGVQHHARFDVHEDGTRFRVAAAADDGGMQVAVDACVAPALDARSTFASLDDASRFFQTGATGYSATARPDGRLDGVTLRVVRWAIEPLAVTRVASSFFDDRHRFPAGSTAFDCALLMRDVVHEWHATASLEPDRRAS
jgi:uncharacterized protein DUF2071